ncbi:MAG: preprotein translocase subunit SecY [Clostridia bacterium]|jgi:preprotein translocase subunit SecY|nr:preprotein translocase subunit SecY [Clostridia bacterium]MDD3231850.1 preprotein translocase subunit SecY [Clostridia bacterium]MDD3862499.1 preprotein translocase subunit SecY [Clostridia bacterium]MDD4408453.1 preprotein translocase subunit SecY [Clostridia bacterium]
MFKTIINAFKVKEVRTKLLITLFLLLIYRIGCWIPLPGIDLEVFQTTTEGNDFLGLISAVSGGALSNGALLALGVAPYITSSIIIQLMTLAIPSLEKLSREGGEEGRKKINFYTRIIALFLSLAQAIGIIVGFGGALMPGVLGEGAPAWVMSACLVLILTAGGMFTVWLGERITDLGIGNGMSLLIFVGILSYASSTLLGSILQVGTDIDYLWNILIFLFALLLIFTFIVIMDLAERRVPVQYAKQVKGRKMYGGQSSYIPIRVNGSGVLPIIFATALVTFPQLISSIFWPESNWYSDVLGTNSWAYIFLTALFILFFAYFAAQITFKPDEISKRIQQNGGFIPGIRAGKPTTEYLTRISHRITLFGAIFLAIIALVPSFVFKFIDISSTGTLVGAFSATGLMIIVSVALEFEKQLDAQMMMRTYKGFLK